MAYTIKMNANKRLITTNRIRLHQHEKLVDKVVFYIPKLYGDFDLSEFQAIIKYVDPTNTAHAELLNAEEELYKDEYIVYTLPVDTNLTRFDGNVRALLTFTKPDEENGVSYVLNTSETVLTILPIKDFFEVTPDASLTYIDQSIIKIQQLIDEMGIGDECNKADNIVLDGDELYLTSKGAQIGDVVNLKDLGQNIADATEDEGLIPIII